VEDLTNATISTWIVFCGATFACFSLKLPSENLPGEIQIGNTQRMTHETYLKPRKKLDKFIFKQKPR